MDKVDDTSSTVEATNMDFVCENAHMEKGSETDLQTIDWDKHPPVVDIKVDPKYLSQNLPSERSKKCFYVLSVALVTISIITVWILLLLPQLCYFGVGICHTSSSDTTQVPFPSQNCTNNYTGNCNNCKNYTGSVCQGHFNTCSNSLVNLQTSTDIEDQLTGLFNYIPRTTQFCREAEESLKVFLCRYNFQPCDDNTDIILPTRSQCEHFRDNVCQSEWEALEDFGIELPNCASLPETFLESSCTDSAATPTLTPSSSPPPSNDNNTMDSSGSDKCLLSYSGTACTSHLSICSGQKTINSFDSSTESFISLFPHLVTNPICKSEQSKIEDFLCRVAFQPCDDDNNIHLPNRTTCENIRDTICPIEWASLQNNTLYSSLLPNCNLLPDVSTPPMCAPNTTSPTSSSPTTTSPTSSSPTTTSPTSSSSPNNSLHCNEKDGFFLYITHDPNSTLINNTCQASCSKWIAFESQALADATDYILLISAIFGVIGGFAVVLFSIIRHERMFQFPSMFIVYQTIILIILGLTVIIQFTDRNSLSCYSNDLLQSALKKPTIFCTLSGFIFIYSILSITYWWFVHVCSTFWKVMFPFHARSHEKKTIYLHLIILIIGIILPIATPLAAYFSQGYVQSRFPPLLCIPSSGNVSYYGLVLPVCIVLGIGITFIVIVLHVLHQKQRLFKHRDTKSYWLGLSAAEIKLLIIFFYYIILGIIDIIGFSINVTTASSVRKSIETNFFCERYRSDPSYNCSKNYLDIRLADGFAVVTYVLLALFTYVNLLFALNFREIKSKFKKCIIRWASEEYRTRMTMTTASADKPDSPFTLRRKLTYSMGRGNSAAQMKKHEITGTYVQKTSNV